MTTAVSTFTDLSAGTAVGGYTIEVAADIDVSSSISLNGVKTTIKGNNTVMYDGSFNSRLFYIQGGADVTFSGVTLKSGSYQGDGGCTYVTGSSTKVLFRSSTFEGCSCRYYYSNGGSGAAIMCCFLILLFITAYMGNRLYRQNKYFTIHWIKQYGKSVYMKSDSDAPVS